LDETLEHMPNWDWVTSGTSIAGDWDYMAWVEGNNWDEIWNHLMELKSTEWRTSALIPIKSWWNQNWKYNWWQEHTAEKKPEIRNAPDQQY
ncbi:MAG: hypothetical protein QCI00_07880, partial [Candidatus Thermoplasmatota archaeon]|nr:hypothetical protein [Candidatus Thermoplasmatota archaeon]